MMSDENRITGTLNHRTVTVAELNEEHDKKVANDAEAARIRRANNSSDDIEELAARASDSRLINGQKIGVIRSPIIGDDLKVTVIGMDPAGVKVDMPNHKIIRAYSTEEEPAEIPNNLSDDLAKVVRGRRQADLAKVKQENLSGGDVNYYLIDITEPKRMLPAVVEVDDISHALEMRFDEGTVWKSLVRYCKLRMDLGKPGSDFAYEAQKIVYYGILIMLRTVGKAKLVSFLEKQLTALKSNMPPVMENKDD